MRQKVVPATRSSALVSRHDGCQVCSVSHHVGPVAHAVQHLWQQQAALFRGSIAGGIQPTICTWLQRVVDASVDDGAARDQA